MLACIAHKAGGVWAKPARRRPGPACREGRSSGWAEELRLGGGAPALGFLRPAEPRWQTGYFRVPSQPPTPRPQPPTPAHPARRLIDVLVQAGSGGADARLGGTLD